MTDDLVALLRSADLPAAEGPGVERVLREVGRRRRRHRVGIAGLGLGALGIVAVALLVVPGRPTGSSLAPVAVGSAPTLSLPASAQSGDTVRLSGTLDTSCRLAELRVSANPGSPSFATFEAPVQDGQWDTTWRVQTPSVPVPVRDSVALLARCADGSGASVSGLLPLTHTPLRFTVSPTSALVGRQVTLTGTVKASCTSVELRIGAGAASGGAIAIRDATTVSGHWSMRFPAPDPEVARSIEALRVNCIHPVSDEQVLVLLPVRRGP